MKRIARILSLLLVMSLAVPAGAQVTDDDIDRARQEVNKLVAESAELGQQVIDAYGLHEDLEHEIDNLRQSIDTASVRIAETEVRLGELAVAMYMGTTSGSNLTILFSASDEDYPAGMEYLKEVNGVDESVIDQLVSFRNELDRQTERLAEALEEQDALTADLEAMSNELQQELIAAQQLYDQLVEQQKREEEERRRAAEEAARRAAEEEARRRAAEEEARRAAEEAARNATTTTTAPATTTSTAPPVTTTTSASSTTTTTLPPSPGGNGTCPVAGAVSFSDSWGAPRSGGRTHKGVDMIAARGTPIVAIYSGRIHRLSNSTLGGLSVYLISDAGDLYYYAHLDSFGDVHAGKRVEEGFVLGYNGSTGNAPEWLPHLHFEYHPDQGAAVNPYPLVKSICG